MLGAVASVGVALLCTLTLGSSSAAPSQTEAWPEGLTAAVGPDAPATSRAKELAPASGYAEKEYFFTGRAHRFSPEGEWGRDGHWEAKASDQTEAFGTRLLVRRPIDPKRFNGIVVVEWMNTTPKFDFDAGWVLLRPELMREGYAWVGVSVQSEGLNGIKNAQATRYGGAHIDDDALSMDIFTQVGLTVKAAQKQLLGSDRPIQMLAMGYSQSALWLNTYINAIAPLSRVYQGFLLHGAAPFSVRLDPSKGYDYNPQQRSDLTAPVLRIQTEMEVMVSWALSDAPDTEWQRYWEVAGASHMNNVLQDALKAIAPSTFLNGPHSCFSPINDMPVQHVDRAALHAMRAWITEGTAPHLAPRLKRGRWGFVQNDDDGNALGGLRLPEMEAPAAHYGMYTNLSNSSLAINHMYLCLAGGAHRAFDAQRLQALYADHSAYVARYKRAADALVTQGLLLPADRDEGLAAAQAASKP